jgi:hypothetical protein
MRPAAITNRVGVSDRRQPLEHGRHGQAKQVGTDVGVHGVPAGRDRTDTPLAPPRLWSPPRGRSIQARLRNQRQGSPGRCPPDRAHTEVAGAAQQVPSHRRWAVDRPARACQRIALDDTTAGRRRSPRPGIDPRTRGTRRSASGRWRLRNVPEALPLPMAGPAHSKSQLRSHGRSQCGSRDGGRSQCGRA